MSAMSAGEEEEKQKYLAGSERKKREQA